MTNRQTRKAPAAKLPAGASCSVKKLCLAFDDLARLNASAAYADALACARDRCLHRVKVHVPAAPGGVVGVGDVVSELRAFAAEITFGCHDETPILNCSNLHPAHPAESGVPALNQSER